MRRFGPAFLIVIPIVVFVAWHRHDEHQAFRLAKPTPTTIAALGRVGRPGTHACDFGECFDYVDVWCQAPCATYSAEGTIVSIKRVRDRAYGGFVLVLRDGSATIAARARLFRKWEPGDRVRVSGVLFFPTPSGRDGGNLPNGAELSPVLALARQ